MHTTTQVDLQRQVEHLTWLASDPVRQLTRLRSVELAPVLPPPLEHYDGSPKTISLQLLDGTTRSIDLMARAAKDLSPIPASVDREDYFPDYHWSYWRSGLIDFERVRHAFGNGRSLDRPSLLDLGSASGRVVRHALNADEPWAVAGCDIDLRNVEWMLQHLPRELLAFQNTIFPHLPLPDASVDVITAFSVFTHIDKLEDAWLLELRRVLRKGGIAYITAHTENVWRRIGERPQAVERMITCNPEWSEPKGIGLTRDSFRRDMPRDHFVLRFEGAGAYVGQAFHTAAYIRSRWGRLFAVEGIHDAGHDDYQDVVVLRK